MMLNSKVLHLKLFMSNSPLDISRGDRSQVHWLERALYGLNSSPA